MKLTKLNVKEGLLRALNEIKYKLLRLLLFLVKVFLANPICWTIYVVILIIAAVHCSTEYQLHQTTIEATVMDKSVSSGSREGKYLVYIQTTNSTGSIERSVLKIDDLFHMPDLDKDARSLLYFKCEVGHRHRFSVVRAPCNGEIFIVSVERID